MPPVQHVALRELMRRTQQQVRTGTRGLRMRHRHRVLQLIAEPEGAARLVIPAACEEPAADGLVEQPAIGEHIHAGVGRLDLDRAEGLLPMDPHLVQRVVRGAMAARGTGQADGVAPVRAHAEPEDDLGRMSGVEVVRHLDGGTWIETRAESPG